MEKQFGIRKILADNPVIPVVNITNVDKVQEILNSLVSQGINCVEITLRSSCAMEAIDKAIKLKPLGFSIGVGTIVSPEQVTDCKALGVDFMVSPGVNNQIAEAFDKAQIPFLPGVMTPSEIITNLNRNWDTFKLFPYNLSGGIKALKTYQSVFEQVKFCPTGGINESSYKEILELTNVMSVGGSWIVKK